MNPNGNKRGASTEDQYNAEGKYEVITKDMVEAKYTEKAQLKDVAEAISKAEFKYGRR